MKLSNDQLAALVRYVVEREKNMWFGENQDKAREAAAKHIQDFTGLGLQYARELVKASVQDKIDPLMQAIERGEGIKWPTPKSWTTLSEDELNDWADRAIELQEMLSREAVYPDPTNFPRDYFRRFK
jgi:hypothetical protein